jgi:uncharacterized membrane protein HdeD (DUF308 family)
MSFRPFRNWWLLALKGALLAAFGLYILFNPGVALTGLVMYLGIAAVVAGAMEIVLAFTSPGDRGSYLFDGLLDLLIGVLLLWKPQILGLVPILLGAWVAVSGIALLVRAFGQRKAGDKSWSSWLILSAVLIALGAQLIFDPEGSMVAVTWILGIVFVLFGALLLFLAFKIRRMRGRVVAAVRDLRSA